MKQTKVTDIAIKPTAEKILASMQAQLDNPKSKQKWDSPFKRRTGIGKNALTGFYNIIANDVILHTDYFMYPEIRSENGVYKDIMKRHKKEFKKSGIKNISIELHEVMLYPKSEGITAIKEAMDSQLPHVRESMNMLNKDEVQERQKDAFDFSNISKMLDNL